MAEISLALAGRGKHEEAFVEWGAKVAGPENTIRLVSSKDLLARLEAACDGGRNSIKKLYIFSHGGIFANVNGEDGDKAGRLFLRDLFAAIRAGKICFSPGGLITMTGCKVAATDFPAALATLTGCVVRAARGMAYPKPGGEGSLFPSERPGVETGEWVSEHDGKIPELNGDDYPGWMEYTGDNLGGVRIGKRVPPDDAYLLRIW